MKEKLDVLRDLMHADLITMHGGKGGTRTTAGFFILFMTAIGMIVSPLAGLYIPFMLGAFFVPTLFQNEIKYHSEKLWGLLPVHRKDLVISRFLMFICIFSAAGLAVYLLMLLSLKLELWDLLFSSTEDDPMPDMIGLMADRFGFSRIGFFNLCYFTAFSFGMCVTAGSLRKYFRDPEKFNFSISMAAHIQKSGKQEFILLGIILGIILLIMLVVTGIIPLGAPVSVIVQLVTKLSQAADGYLLGAVLLTIDGFYCAYQYISTLIEYDQREL